VRRFCASAILVRLQAFSASIWVPNSSREVLNFSKEPTFWSQDAAFDGVAETSIPRVTITMIIGPYMTCASNNGIAGRIVAAPNGCDALTDMEVDLLFAPQIVLRVRVSTVSFPL
jgi:hypothetical protein